MDKQAWREHIWERMTRESLASFPGAQGRVPNFSGAALAAERLAQTDAWRASFVIKVNADETQRPVRLRALRDGKVLVVPVPRLAEVRCFLRVDPEEVPGGELPRAATLRGARRYGIPIRPKEVPLLDLVVAGSVVVNAMGQRVGKGGGHADLEFALGRENGFLLEETVIATTIHPVQFVDDPLPVTSHDFDVDIIATPAEVIRTIRSRPRPRGVLWDHLEPEKLDEIPVLGRMRRGRGPLRSRR